MEHFLHALKQAQESKTKKNPTEILDEVQEWKGMGENLLNSLIARVSEIDSREKSLKTLTESVEKKLKDLEFREKKIQSLKKIESLSPVFEGFSSNVKSKEEKLDDQLKEVREHIEKLEVDRGEVCKKLKGIEIRKREFDRKLRDVEEREREFESYRDRINGELGLREGKVNEVEEKMKGIEKREKEIEGVRRTLERRVKEVETREREIECGRGELDKKLKEVEVREREFELYRDRRNGEISLKESKVSEVEEKMKGIEKKEREIEGVRRTLERRLNEVETREKEFVLFQNRKAREMSLKESALSEVEGKRVTECEEKMKGIEKKEKDIEGVRRTLERRLKDVEMREKEFDFTSKSLERRSKMVEEREKEFDLLQERKLKEFNSKDEVLSKKREEVDEVVKYVNEKFREREKLGQVFVERLELALQMVKSMNTTLDERFGELESWESRAHESLNASINESESIRELTEKQLREFVKMEMEFHLLQTEERQKMESREQQLCIMRKDLDKEVKLMDDKLAVQRKLGNTLVEGLETKVTKKLKEIETKEATLNVSRETLDASIKEADLVRESANIRFKEVEKREEEFRLYEEKLRKKLVVEEEKLRSSNEKFIEEVKLRKEKLDKQEKLVQGLQEKLELAQKDVKDMSTVVTEKLKEIGTKEEELLEKEKVINAKETSLISKENELEEKKKELESKEKESENISEKDRQSECRLTELASEEKQMDVQIKNLEVEHQQLVEVKIEPVTKMVRKTLEMFLNNNSEKDLELMGDEAFKVLLVSSDPAKLVLDAMLEFYAPHLGKGDKEDKLWRTCTLLLDQLSKMSPDIQPCVRDEAIRLATDWKLKLRNVAENPMELLAFLHLLAAYDLSSGFNKDDLLCFLKEVSHHKQTPELYRIFGFTADIHDVIQNLINEKQYLLASTYIHECELDDVFPQASVLNYHVRHSKMLAKARCRLPEEQDKAIARVIADLRNAVDHIVKYGLEAAYSPDIVTAQIRQFERTRANLKNTKLPELTDREASCLSPDAQHLHNNMKKRPPTTPVGAPAKKLQRFTRPMKDRLGAHPCTTGEPSRQIASRR